MKVFIKTYGCQMNVRDSEALAGMLTNAGAELTELEAEADVMIFNLGKENSILKVLKSDT